MKVLFLPQSSALGPSSRYRVYQLLPALARLGIEAEVSPGLDDDLYRVLYLDGGPRASRLTAFSALWRRRRADLQRIDAVDAVVVQKGVLPGLSARFERRIARQKPFVFDFDDAIWLPRVGGHPLLRLLHRESRVRFILEQAAAVIAGNEFLAAYARRFNPRVTVVPSAIDLARYLEQPGGASAVHSRPAAGGAGDSARYTPIVGWIGSRSTLAYLQPLGPVFRELGITPRIIAAGDPSALGLPADFVPWNPDTEIAELGKLDIGIAPLPDTPWEQGKCGVKLLQYMACGLAVVASPVGVHRAIIRPGVNGLLASSAAEWRDALARLQGDPALRERLGAAGRTTVAERYDLPQVAAQVATVLRGVCS